MTLKHCAICKGNSEEVDLFEGLYDNKISMICEKCADEENIPLIKKPTDNQLEMADKKYSVRERMENMTGFNKPRTHISSEQIKVQRSLNKLKIPEKKQYNSDIVDNYYWDISLARRRRKMTINQLSQKIDVPIEILKQIEKGQIPEDFEQIFVRLEGYFGIKLLKKEYQKVNFYKTQEGQDEILNKVKARMQNTVNEDKEYEEVDKIKLRRQIEEHGIDFSDKKKLDNITLNDLVDLKRQKEAREEQEFIEQKRESLIGDDIDIEFE